MSDFNGLHDCREYREHVKDLSGLAKDFCRIVIVDNNPFSFILQPLNGIPCAPFSAGQHSDDQVSIFYQQLFIGSGVLDF
jgi:TFIIF-interacting CTD phosphatase-like protein